jgi:hypothetical protein
MIFERWLGRSNNTHRLLTEETTGTVSVRAVRAGVLRVGGAVRRVLCAGTAAANCKHTQKFQGQSDCDATGETAKRQVIPIQ